MTKPKLGCKVRETKLSTMKKAHIALITMPNDHEIVAVPWLIKPSEPTHSGFIDEETRIMNHYYARLRDYEAEVKLGIKCDLEAALKILNEQYPERKVLPYINAHYNVVNVNLGELLGMPKRIFIEGQELTCMHNALLPGNENGPDLELGEKYPLKKIITDSKGNPHFDVGLKSPYEYIRSYETGEYLPDGDKIHWCHPLRFI